MDKIIHCKVGLNCGLQQSFEMFTRSSNIQRWLANDAHIEPYVGGKYELFWDTDNKEINSTIGCKITAFEADKLLCFEWKGPEQFAYFMNVADPLTHVSVLFIPDSEHDGVTEIHLIHTGWRNDEHWEKARIWFESVWMKALDSLKSKVLE